MIVHAGLIATLLNTQWRGVLILGPSGSGKSDLAIRAMQHGFRLVADDRVLLFKSGGRIFGRAPDTLQGLMEFRGIGVVAMETRRLVEVSLVVVCVGPGEAERTPAPQTHALLGIDHLSMAICALEPSAPAKLCRALEVLGRREQQDYDAAFPRPAPRQST